MLYVIRSSEGLRISFTSIVMAIYIIAMPSCVFSQEVETTIYIVRHAEKLDNSADSPLSQAGVERAQKLAHVLKEASLTSIFVSNRLRTQQTAAPTAEIFGIVPKRIGNATNVADEILSDELGGRILVVGHSESLDNIAAGLGVKGVPELKQKEYDRLFLVHMIGSEVYLHTLRYGEPTE